jgi:hypothetical protein
LGQENIPRKLTNGLSAFFGLSESSMTKQAKQPGADEQVEFFYWHLVSKVFLTKEIHLPPLMLAIFKSAITKFKQLLRQKIVLPQVE